jgi:uroporphyrinogen III methyltransferase/synthase
MQPAGSPIAAPGDPTAQPLAGRRIAITRPAEQAAGLTEALVALGAQVAPLGAIAIVPIEDPALLDAAIARLASYDWLVFTSINGVRAFAERLAATSHVWGDRGAARLAAIGPATAQALETQGVAVDLLPGAYVAEGILATLEQRGEIAGRRFLLPRADIARETLAQELARQGAQVDEIAAYRTVTRPVPGEALRRALQGDARVDAITFTSSSTVRGFVQGMQGMAQLATDAPAFADIPAALKGIALAAIGPITAATLREHQLEPTIVADEYTIPGLVRTLVAYFVPSTPSTAMAPDRITPPHAGEGAPNL